MNLIKKIKNAINKNRYKTSALHMALKKIGCFLLFSAFEGTQNVSIDKMYASLLIGLHINHYMNKI